MSRSHRANHYGTLFERKAFEKYRLEPARASWRDAVDRDGTSVEVKATMHRHADGQPGTFKLYRKYHEKLRRQNGVYVFGVYKPRGQGISVLRTQMIHSSKLPLLTWHGGGAHRETQQAKIGISEIFG